MTVPFEPRPNDPDADHLNTLLDAMRSGSRAPDAASPESHEAAALADAVDQFRGLVRRADAPAAAYLDDHLLQNRWEDIMMTAFPTAPPADATAWSLTPAVPVSNRTRRASAPPIPNRLNAWLSAAIVALMLLGTVGGAWWLGPGGSGPSDDGRTRLAAVTQTESSPEAIWPTPLSPEEAPWIAAITPDECTAEPMSQEEYAKAITTDPDGILDHSYEVVGPAEREVAAEAVATTRGLEACMNAGQLPQARAYQTTDNLFFNSGSTTSNAPYSEEIIKSRLAVGKEASAYLSTADPSDFTVVVSGIEPSSSVYEEIWNASRELLEGPNPAFDPFLLYFEHRFNPENALMMSDGRILIPATRLLWEDDPMVQAYGVPDQEIFTSEAVILEKLDCQWLVDETNIWICVGECDAYWTQMSGETTTTPVSTTDATPQAVTGAPAKITDLLAAVPADMPGQEEGPNIGWTYADVEQQLANMGFTPEEAVADPLQVIGSEDFASIAWASGIFHYSTDEEFVAAIGFNPFMARQVLGAFTFHDSIIVLRGDWNVDTLTAAWESAGYTPYTTASGVPAWTIGPNGEIDPTHPIQSKGFQSLNNVAILDGGILAYAGYSTTIEMVIQTQSGEMASAIDDSWLQPLFSAVSDETISGIGFTQPGSTLYDLGEIAANPNLTPDDRASIEDQLRASREAVGPMPEYRGAIFTVEGDPTGEGAIIVQMRAFSGEDAEQVARVVEWRWENLTSQRYQRTFDSIMPLVGATVDGDIVTLRFDPQSAPGMWLELLQGGDLLVFAVDAGLPVGTPDATPAATPGAISPIDDIAWTTCPEYQGPWELASRPTDGTGTLNGIPPTWGPAEPPTVPCPTPGLEPPVDFTPVPLN